MAAARSTTERARTSSRGELFQAAGDAAYQEAEIHRLRGQEEAAEAAYRAASERGRDPQPGLALLRLMQGRTADAVAAIRAALAATGDRLRRVRYLPAAVDILLAAGDKEEADRASSELEAVAADFKTELLGAMAAHTRGAVSVASGQPQVAIEPLRHALRLWREADAPYIVARIRVLLARACRQAGDADAAAVEEDLARKTFADLGAGPDLAALGRADRTSPRPHGLSARELEVLRLVATGKTNKAIAHQLHLSEKTVDRHVSNIFVKIDVGTRAAATAYAYQHRLV